MSVADGIRAREAARKPKPVEVPKTRKAKVVVEPEPIEPEIVEDETPDEPTPEDVE